MQNGFNISERSIGPRIFFFGLGICDSDTETDSYIDTDYTYIEHKLSLISRLMC